MEREYHSLQIIIGSMYSGKTEELLRRIRRYIVADEKTQLFNHVIDKTRYGPNKVGSHAGNAMDSFMAENVDHMYTQLKDDTRVVGINEGQFFGEEIIDFCKYLVNDGRLVIVSALNQDFRGEDFPLGKTKTIGNVIALADEVTHLTAICTYMNGTGRPCSKSATRTQRLVNGNPADYNDAIVIVGAKELYEARCPSHHFVPGKPKNAYDRFKKFDSCIFE